MLHNLDSGEERVRYQMIEELEIPASGLIAAALDARPQEPLRVFTRLTTVDGAPVALWDTYTLREIAVPFGPPNPDRDIYDFFGDIGVFISRANMQVGAVLADSAVARVLQVEIAQPLLSFERALFDDHDRCVAVSFGRARADRMQLAIDRSRP